MKKIIKYFLFACFFLIFGLLSFVIVSPVKASTSNMKVWVLEYLPTNGISSLYPNAEVTDPTIFTQNTLLPAMNEASRYHGYSDASASAALNYTLDPADIHVEYITPPQANNNSMGSYDYTNALFNKYDLCNYAKANDIKAVIVWGAGSGPYYSGLWESAVTSNKIRANGATLTDCPDKTIVVYGFNYERGLAEAMESYGHQLETVFRDYRSEYQTWADESAAANSGLVGKGDSCGSDHNPPNARYEYDRYNMATVSSDCRNWKPDGSGIKENMSCTWWGCTPTGWLTFWMQNMPGMDNGLVDSVGQPIPSWWDYIANPDSLTPAGTFSSMSASLGRDTASFNYLFSGQTVYGSIDVSTSSTFSSNVYWNFATGYNLPLMNVNPNQYYSYYCGRTIYWQARSLYSTSPIRSAVVTCPTDTTRPVIAITSPTNNSTVSKGSTVAINVSATDNARVARVEISVGGVVKCTLLSGPYTCNWAVPTNGSKFTITATAYDTSNNSASSSVRVNAR
ncbi:MAG TPA: Ig-like domain-containing protein [Patescibacteria group bacterium]